MIESDLRQILSDVGITQADFARLIGVTPRAVALWMSGERAIPGPAESYARLLQSLPANLRQVELARLKNRRNDMRDGMYSVQFESISRAGQGIVILDTGRAYGADTVGCKFDGEYIFNEVTGLADLDLKITYPPNVASVFGTQHPYEWSIELKTSLNPRVDAGTLQITTPLGPDLKATYKFLRTLPES